MGTHKWFKPDGVIGEAIEDISKVTLVLSYVKTYSRFNEYVGSELVGSNGSLIESVQPPNNKDTENCRPKLEEFRGATRLIKPLFSKTHNLQK